MSSITARHLQLNGSFFIRAKANKSSHLSKLHQLLLQFQLVVINLAYMEVIAKMVNVYILQDTIWDPQKLTSVLISIAPWLELNARMENVFQWVVANESCANSAKSANKDFALNMRGMLINAMALYAHKDCNADSDFVKKQK